MSADRQTISITNDLAETVRVAETVKKFCACHGVPANAVFQINLAIDELLTNTISYGFPDGEPHEIIVELAWQGEDIVIDLIDDGIAFNPLEAPEPDLDAPLEERKVGGLGVYFVKTMMSAVTYSRQDNRNRLHLRKCFGSNA